jgi:hypothetical protein
MEGPASAVSGQLASFSGTGGKLLQDSGMGIDTDALLAANSDKKLATQRAVRSYVAANAGAGSGVTSLSVFNIKDEKYNAKGDGSTDDATAIQGALNAAYTAGGGIVYVPPGTYIVGTKLEIDDRVTLCGSSWYASILKLKAGAKVSILECKRFGVGGTTGGTENITIEDLQFDGNIAENAGVTAPVVNLDGINPVVRRVFIKKGNINLLSKMSRGDLSSTKVEDGIFEEIRLFDSKEFGFKFEGPHDSQMDNLLCKTNEGIGLSARMVSVWSACHSYGNCNYPIEAISGTWYNNIAEGGKLAQVAILADGIVWSGGQIFNGGGEDGKVGFQFGSATQTAFSCRLYNVKIEGCTNGAFKFSTASTSGIYISGFAFAASGNAWVGTAPDTSVDFTHFWVTGGQGDNTKVRSIASAGAVPAPCSPIAEYTGVAEINTLQFGKTGQQLLIRLPSTAKLVTSGNISSALNGPSSAMYVFDGTKWYRA